MCRIIAAASKSPGAAEAKGTVSADGVPEVANESTQTVTSEAAVIEEDKNKDPTPIGEDPMRSKHPLFARRLPIVYADGRPPSRQFKMTAALIA